MLKKTHIDKIYFILCLVVYAIASFFIMPSIDNQAGLGTNDIANYEFLAMIVSLPYILLGIKSIINHNNKLLFSYIVFFVWSFVISLLTLDGISELLFSIYPIAPLLVSYLYFLKNPSDRIINSLFIVTFIAVSVQYFHIYYVANQYNTANIGVSYFPLLVLPFIFLNKSKLIKLAALLLTTFIIITSGKRGGLLALVLGIAVYLFCRIHLIDSKREKISFIVITCIAILSVVIVLSLNLHDMDFSSNLFDRITNIANDKGSGRLFIWQKVISDIGDSDMLSFLFGHGYRSVAIDYGPNLVPAHNDFLEVFYDFGLIGLIMYIFIWILLIKKALYLYRTKNEYTPTFCFMLSLYFIFSMISIVLYYFWITYILLMIGLVTGREKLNICKQQTEL